MSQLGSFRDDAYVGIRGDNAVVKERFKNSFNRPDGKKTTRLPGVSVVGVGFDNISKDDMLNAIRNARVYGRNLYLIEGDSPTDLQHLANDPSERLFTNNRVVDSVLEATPPSGTDAIRAKVRKARVAKREPAIVQKPQAEPDWKDGGTLSRNADGMWEMDDGTINPQPTAKEAAASIVEVEAGYHIAIRRESDTSFKVMFAEWDGEFGDPSNPRVIDFRDMKKAEPSKLPPKKPAADLFGADEMPFNLTGERVEPPTAPKPPAPTEPPASELFTVQSLTKASDTVKVADALVEQHGDPKTARDRLLAQIIENDKDPVRRKEFTQEQRAAAMKVAGELARRALPFRSGRR
jgi:hypothetical protein